MALGNQRILERPEGLPQEARGEPPPVQRGPRQIPWVAGGVIVVSVAFFLLGEPLARLVPHPMGPRGDQLLPLGGLYGPLVRAGEWWRPLLFVFEHGGPLHLGFNMYVTFSLGFALERMIGSWRMLLCSIIGALAFPIALWFVLARDLDAGSRTTLMVSASLIVFLVLLRHRANISRLLSGTENKLGGTRTA